jgi:protein-disulfide isomerase
MPKAETANGTAAPVRQINIKGAPSKGDEKSPVTMVVFTDFQCPFCSRVVPTLEQVQRGYVDKVKLVFKNFPLDFHPDAQLAHEAAMAAADQGKFWEMHDVIFANQRSLERADLLRFAEQVGLDMKRFVADLDGRKFRAAIEADKLEAAELGVTGTPAIFVNGKMLSGARPLADFRALVDAEIPGAVWTEPTTMTAAKLSAEKREEFDERIVKGAKNAPITLLWFSDMQSSLSPRAAQLIQQVMDANPGKVRVVFKHRPLEQLRPNAIEVHEAALAVGAQGKFWEMHDLLLANQKSLTREDLIKLAARPRRSPCGDHTRPRSRNVSPANRKRFSGSAPPRSARQPGLLRQQHTH